MGPKQDPRDDSQLEQRDECDSEQRVVERCDHGEQGVGCEQGANLRGLRANGIRTRARLRREREENGSGEDSKSDRPPFSLRGCSPNGRRTSTTTFPTRRVRFGTDSAMTTFGGWLRVRFCMAPAGTPSCDCNVLARQGVIDGDGEITAHLSPVLMPIGPSSKLKGYRTGTEVD